ncbi:hypothetical protein [Aeoliella mucimassa]|uniref:Uncharacterized protein n=1 Tax=Aeoliella mucimassa TaxID=2527972 RepID=A0A518ATA3_9BACT|nr:hypothetical protein [Aeoliella mucimassa]QDU57952.1 hypothetical protein Pan181_41760 [Aeoliella mucimassa]
MDNPYSSPQVATALDVAESVPPPPDRERLALLGEVFIAWERLRIWYNLVLGGVS